MIAFISPPHSNSILDNGSSIPSRKERLIVFDFIRLFAIIMIVFGHNFRFGNIQVASSYLGILGNGIFFFISGYLIYINNMSIKSKVDILHFYKKRLLRIYPLYIVAVIVSLLVFTIMEGYSYDIFEIVVSLFGFQMIFYPKFITNTPLLWFIGMIIIYYLIYPIVIYFCRNNWVKYFIYSCIALGIMVGLRLLTGLIGGGVFEYYFVFIFGVICGMTNIFKSKYITPITILSLIIFVGCLCIIQLFNPQITDILILSSNIVIHTVGVIALRMIYGISAVFILYTLYNRLNLDMHITQLIFLGAFAAYAVFLFEKPYFIGVNAFLSSFGSISPLGYDILFVVLLLPMLFIVCYYIQKGEMKFINGMKARLAT